MSEGNGSIYLTRDEILKADDLPYEDVPVDEWSKSKKVRVRGLTGKERGVWEATVSSYHPSAQGKLEAQFDFTQMRVALCTLCIVDADGKRLFEDHEVELLGRKSSIALERVYKVAVSLSGINKEAVEQAVKGSGETSESEAGSDSASSSDSHPSES